MDGLSNQFLLEIELDRERVESFDDYPFSLSVVAQLHKLQLQPHVTFIVGENGAGKSTMLEAIAIAWGFNAEGGGRSFQFDTRRSHSVLHDYLQLSRGVKRPKHGYFLRAESFFNVATEIENLDEGFPNIAKIGSAYGTRSLHEQSHGESFLSLLMDRFGGNGFYILDEPEAALSPSRQLAVLARIHDLVNEGSQFIIATHSPIIMAYPDSCIYQLTDDGIGVIDYKETEHFSVTKAFLNNPEGMLRTLTEEG